MLLTCFIHSTFLLLLQLWNFEHYHCLFLSLCFSHILILIIALKSQPIHWNTINSSEFDCCLSQISLNFGRQARYATAELRLHIQTELWKASRGDNKCHHFYDNHIQKFGGCCVTVLLFSVFVLKLMAIYIGLVEWLWGRLIADISCNSAFKDSLKYVTTPP